MKPEEIIKKAITEWRTTLGLNLEEWIALTLREAGYLDTYEPITFPNDRNPFLAAATFLDLLDLIIPQVRFADEGIQKAMNSVDWNDGIQKDLRLLAESEIFIRKEAE